MLRVPEGERVPDDPAQHPPRSTPAPPPPPPAPVLESEFPNPAEAPLQPVRGTRFWITVVAATLALGVCGCCGLAALFLPGPEWRTYESKQGGFRVDLPGAPRSDMARRMRLQRAIAVEGTYLWMRAEHYAVAYRNRSEEESRRPPDEALDEQVKSLARGHEVRRMTRTEPIRVRGFPGREFEYETRDGGVYTGRIILADRRVFILLAGGRFTEPDDENVRQFLDSFEITDPQLLVASQRQTRDQLRDAGAAAAVAAMEAVEAELER